jgi:signal transduction histidine kinase
MLPVVRCSRLDIPWGMWAEEAPVSWWHVGAAANLVILAAYLAIAFTIVRHLIPQGRWRSSPLAVATAGIFFTCAVHHGSHPVHQLLPALGAGHDTGLAMRAAFDTWHVSGWDVITAAVGVWYWTLRSRLPALVRRSALFEDGLERERQALEIHDNVVQGLASAKLAFELDERDRGLAALEQTLTSARRIITDLLGTPGDFLTDGGGLRRDRPAGRGGS